MLHQGQKISLYHNKFQQMYVPIPGLNCRSLVFDKSGDELNFNLPCNKTSNNSKTLFHREKFQQK